MEKSIFRKSSLERISSPEQLNEYVKVTNPGIWLVLLGLFILLFAVGIWAFTGSIPETVQLAGVAYGGEEQETDTIYCYVPLSVSKRLNTVEKTEAFQPGGRPRSVIEFAKKRLRGSFVPFIFVVLTGALTAIVGLVNPLFSRILLDNILSGKNPEWLFPLLGAMVLAFFFQFVVGIIEAIYWLRIEGRFAITANAEFMWHVLRLPVEFFSQRYAGDIVFRQASNQEIAGTLIRQLAPVLMNVGLLLIYLIIMINYSLPLTAIGILAAMLNIVVMRFTANKQVNLSRTAMASAGKLYGTTMSGIEMIETIKAAGAENGFFERWAGYHAKQHNAQVAINRFMQYFSVVPSLLQQIANIAVLMTGVYLILDGMFTIGMLMAFQGFLASFLTPVNQLIGVGQGFINMRSSMERV